MFLDRARMAIVVDLDQDAGRARPRAIEVLKQWQGRERLIAMLDMTTPGMAVVRLKTDLPSWKSGAREIARNGAPEPARVSIAERGAVGAMRNMLAGLDVGTSKVCAIVGRGADRE